MTINRHKWDGVTIRVRAPEGTVFVHILEEKPGKIHKIILNIGKSGSSVQASAHAIAELVSTLFESGKAINEVIAKLSSITSDRLVRDNEHEVRSIPEAIVIALMKYRQSIPPDKNSGKTARWGKSRLTR